MISKWIWLLAIAFSVFAATFDLAFHNHFSCEYQLKQVTAALEAETHLKEYMIDQVDYTGQPEDGKVTCECSPDKKIVLKGKVDRQEYRQEFSDIAIDVIGGPSRVDNQIEVLNHGALAELQDLLASPPTGMTMNYQVKDRGTIYLTGDLPDPALKERVGRMVAKIGGVRSVFNDLGRQLDVPQVLRIHNIYFNFNQWDIRPESQARLDEVAQILSDYFAKNASGVVRIEGHTDSIATDAYNQKLSEKRAESVLSALVARGLPKARMKPVGMGESKLLIANDDTPEKRAENRRIEFHFGSEE